MNKGRLILVWAILFSSILGLAGKIYRIQIVQGAALTEKAKQRQIISVSPYLPRKPIIDRFGHILALDRQIYTLYVHPRIFKKTQQEVASELVEILPEHTVSELVARFSQQPTGIRLADNLTRATAAEIRQLQIDGLELTAGYARIYPQQEMVAQVIGYVQKDNHQGKAGLEAYYQDILAQSSLKVPIHRVGNGLLMPYSQRNSGEIPPYNSDNLRLQLTINLQLQRVAREALKAQMEKYKALRGAVVVMDATNGELLALVCEPTYDPNAYSQFGLELFKNWVVSDLYEPGSTFKPINVAIALEAGVIKPTTVIKDPGTIKVDGWNIFNHDYHSQGGHGDLNIAQILQHSSNVGMIEIMQRLDREAYYRSLQNLGLAEKTNIDLPGEVVGKLKLKSDFLSREIEAATASFGQGISLTAIKLLQLHGAIANGGKLVTPHVVSGLVDFQGKIYWKPQRQSKQLFSPQTARSVLEMMESVVTEGSGQVAQIPGYRIAGKTGTAQKPSPTGGYRSKAKITSFVSILPVDSPRYVVLTIVDEPQGQYTFGSTVAAPISKSVMEALIFQEQIAPSIAVGNLSSEFGIR